MYKQSRASCLVGLLLATMLWMLLPPAAFADAWARDASGICERSWTLGSLLRGPTAMVNGLALPLRSLAGSLIGGPVAAATSPVGLAIGIGEGIGWVLVGSLETVTGGTLGVAPEVATSLHVSPVLQFPFGARRYSTRDASHRAGCSDG